MHWVAGTVPDYLDRWGVRPCGEPITTPSSWLVPGRWREKHVMLKVARVAEEARGGRILAWWEGSAAAAVHEVSDQAILMDRAFGQRDLAAMSQTGLDDEVTGILCGVISSLHGVSAQSTAPAEVVPLSQWFHDLTGAETARPRPGNIGRVAPLARELVEASGTQAQVVLHGDIHHGNVLDFGGRWLAIDPKGLVGHRAFDYANIFCNPTTDVALSHFHRRVAIVSERSGLDVDEVRSWVIAWCALSATWIDNSGGQPWTAHAIMSEFG